MKWRVKTLLGFCRFLLPLLPLLMLIRNLNRNLLLILLLLPCCPKWMTRQRTKFPAPSLAPLPFSPHGAKAPPPATKQPPKPPTGGTQLVEEWQTHSLARSSAHQLTHSHTEWMNDWLTDFPTLKVHRQSVSHSNSHFIPFPFHSLCPLPKTALSRLSFRCFFLFQCSFRWL